MDNANSITATYEVEGVEPVHNEPVDMRGHVEQPRRKLDLVLIGGLDELLQIHGTGQMRQPSEQERQRRIL